MKYIKSIFMVVFGALVLITGCSKNSVNTIENDLVALNFKGGLETSATKSSSTIKAGVRVKILVSNTPSYNLASKTFNEIYSALSDGALIGTPMYLSKDDLAKNDTYYFYSISDNTNADPTLNINTNTGEITGIKNSVDYIATNYNKVLTQTDSYVPLVYERLTTLITITLQNNQTSNVSGVVITITATDATKAKLKVGETQIVQISDMISQDNAVAMNMNGLSGEYNMLPLAHNNGLIKNAPLVTIRAKVNGVDKVYRTVIPTPENGYEAKKHYSYNAYISADGAVIYFTQAVVTNWEFVATGDVVVEDKET